ncbi:MAG: hypothetical protein CL946_01050 [Ectothiorhodospiraceae bacterium]|nr:hypothetical protein [Ectothiorhodospiraceae bacterium]
MKHDEILGQTWGEEMDCSENAETSEVRGEQMLIVIPVPSPRIHSNGRIYTKRRTQWKPGVKIR